MAPSEQIVPVLTEATFKCQPMCSESDWNVIWTVNKTSLGATSPPNITTYSESDQNGRMYTLTIAALSQYNTTTVECVLIYLDGGTRQTSPSAKLWIQGLLRFCITLVSF